MDRRLEIVTRLLRFVSDYYRSFGKPVQMRVLSAKYAKMAMDCGGFPELIESLTMDGSIKVFLLRSGAKVVYPFDAAETVVIIDAMKL